MSIKRSDNKRIDDAFGSLINLISSRINEERDKALAERGLTNNLFNVMLNLMIEGVATQIEPVDCTSNQCCATSGALERLESKRLITRTFDSSGGRSHWVCLTEEGLMLCNSLLESFELLNQGALEALSEQDQKTTMTSLIKIASWVS